MKFESLTTLTPPLLQLALDFCMLIYLCKIEKKKKKIVTYSQNPKNQWCCCFWISLHLVQDMRA